MEKNKAGFKREIKLFDAVMVVAGTMIGSGIPSKGSDISFSPVRLPSKSEFMARLRFEMVLFHADPLA